MAGAMPRPRKAPPKPARRAWHSGTISTLRDGRIRARLPAAADPKRTAREFPAGRRDLAEQWLAAMLAPASAAPEQAATVTLGDWAGVWYETYVVPLRSPTSCRYYRYSLRHLAPLFDAPIAEVRQSSLQGIVGTLAATLTPATVRAVVGVWQRCLDAAVDDDLIARNPAKRLLLPKHGPKPTQRRLTQDEARAILAASVGHRYEAAYALLIGCGLRMGEVLALRWSDIDLANRRAWICRQYTDGLLLEQLKGRNPHHVALPPLVVAALIRHRDRQPPGNVLVFQTPWRSKLKSRPKGEPWPLDRKSIVTDLGKLLRELGIEHATPHAARRGLASALIEGGASPAAVASRLGHADPSITLRAYTVSDTDAAQKADRLTDEYLGGGFPDGFPDP